MKIRSSGRIIDSVGSIGRETAPRNTHFNDVIEPFKTLDGPTNASCK